MSEAIDFVIRDKVNGGRDLTPATIDFTRFNEFNRQVEDFIAGSDQLGTGQKLALDTVHVEIQEGSYCLRVWLTRALLAAVEPQIAVLTQRQDALSSIDEKRAKVVERWQSKAKTRDTLTYEVRIHRSDGRDIRPLEIGPNTNFRHDGSNPWVKFERYIFGTVNDMGGEVPNIHVKLPDTGQILIVSAKKEILRGKGILYENALLHVTGEQNLDTAELRKLHLLDFVNYNPNYDPAALERFMAEGRKAWPDVPDAAAWVREMRGG